MQTGNSPKKRTRANAGWAVAYFAAVVLFFGPVLASLVSHALSNDLHSHTLLIPLVCGYLVYLKRGLKPEPHCVFSIKGAVLFSLGIAAAVASWEFSPLQLSRNNAASLQALGFICCLLAGGHFFLGPEWMKTHAFAVAFLFFMIPLPDQAIHALETGFKLASAEAAAVLFSATDVPVYRDGLMFHLPGITLEVAQECSGIRSTWVLIITACLCAYLFLESTWRRVVIVALVIPLGVIRNGFRIVVLGIVCTRFGPEWIDSFIHTHGGPIFFILSLIPLVLAVGWLRSNERRSRTERERPSTSSSGDAVRVNA